MSIKEIAGKLASLEAEIKVLKAELQVVAAKEPTAPKGLSSLKGVWKGQIAFTEEKIKAAQIRL